MDFLQANILNWNCLRSCLQFAKATPDFLVVLLFLSVSEALLPRLEAQNTHVVHYAVEGSPKWAVATAPTWTVSGTLAGRDVLNWVGGVLELANGDLVVSNLDPIRLYRFDRRGQLIAAFGSKGGGPGEYNDITTLSLGSPDTLVILDAMARAATVLTTEGRYIRSFRLDSPAAGAPTFLVPVGAGSVLVGFADPPPGPKQTAQYFSQQVQVVSLSGDVVARLGRFPLREHFVQRLPDRLGGVAYWDRAFGLRQSFVGVQKGFATGDGSGPEVRVFDRNGKLIELHQFPAANRPVTNLAKRRYADRLLSRTKDVPKEVTRRQVDEMPYPETFPYYNGILTDPIGRLWLRRYPQPGETAENWMVLDSSRGLLSEIALPSRFSLMVIGRGYLIGVWTDEDDVEHLRRYEILPVR